ncbi:MAG: G8 domain-containing protein [Chloroflexi bacterium]|nr:G8 domain-containing protein [Chloroflexota bacterium]
MFRQQYFRIGLSLIVALFLWTVSGVKPAAAAPEATCTSNGSGSWGTTGTWTGCGGLVPQTGDTVIIATGHTVTVNTNTASLASLTVNGTLTIGNSGTDRNVNVAGDVTISSDGLIQPGTTDADHILNIGGNLLNNGTFNGQVADPDDEIRVTFNSASDQTISGTGLIQMVV